MVLPGRFGRQVGKGEAARQQKYDFGQRQIAKLEKMLEFPLARVTTETVDRPGGPVRVTTVMPAKRTFDTVGRLGKIAWAQIDAATRNTGNVSGDEMERDEDW